MSLFDIYKAKKLNTSIKIDDVLGEKYGIVDMGTLTWSYDSAAQRFVTSSLVGVYKWIGSRQTPFVSALYDALTKNEPFDASWNMVIYSGGDDRNVAVHNHSYTSASDFKTAMSGVYLIYEKAV